ncbi:MAG: hypothetical protein LUC30_07600 [Clostridiales bacterium]|nr:hypothetical protein [Clostridiales bacterium]
MKKAVPVVHCDYAKDGKSLSELIEESFRSYLIRIIAATDGDVVQYPR